MKPMKRNVNIGNVTIHTHDVMVFGIVLMELTKLIVIHHLYQNVHVIITSVFHQRRINSCVCISKKPMMEKSIVLGLPMSQNFVEQITIN
jgi:hypothetical protein